MDILGKLFSSNALVKIMRLFLSNPEQAFENKDIVERSKVTNSSLRTEIAILKSIGFVKKKVFYKEIVSKTKTKKTKKPARVRKKKVQGWTLNSEFPYLHSLRNLLLNSELVNRKNTVDKIKTIGSIKLVVLSGVFLGEDASRVDILIVGDKMSKNKLNSVLKIIESEIGKELEYAVMETKEFNYRLGMYDKFIRDILDYPHEKLIDKIGL